tara:strand:+ start:71 stop:361 length:291 start_codon:yes stop_codon:yes gene_type:complete
LIYSLLKEREETRRSEKVTTHHSLAFEREKVFFWEKKDKGQKISEERREKFSDFCSRWKTDDAFCVTHTPPPKFFLANYIMYIYTYHEPTMSEEER